MKYLSTLPLRTTLTNIIRAKLQLYKISNLILSIPSFIWTSHTFENFLYNLVFLYYVWLWTKCNPSKTTPFSLTIVNQSIQTMPLLFPPFSLFPPSSESFIPKERETPFWIANKEEALNKATVEEDARRDTEINTNGIEIIILMKLVISGNIMTQTKWTRAIGKKIQMANLICQTQKKTNYLLTILYQDYVLCTPTLLPDSPTYLLPHYLYSISCHLAFPSPTEKPI